MEAATRLADAACSAPVVIINWTHHSTGEICIDENGEVQLNWQLFLELANPGPVQSFTPTLTLQFGGNE